MKNNEYGRLILITFAYLLVEKLLLRPQGAAATPNIANRVIMTQQINNLIIN